ncbi:hypothetical protein GCM10011586_28010 [Silvibacterium dinghuense]|nr:hypothetical protein GCM10011586_28010 [Silvibacterium dinghuense]
MQVLSTLLGKVDNHGDRCREQYPGNLVPVEEREAEKLGRGAAVKRGEEKTR